MAAFHLHLSGPALVWYSQLSDVTKLSCTSIEADFRNQYISLSALDPSLIMESALFDSLQLSATQQLEDFHSLIWEKGHKLEKPERDMINKFIEGLPAQLAFFVRVSRCTTFRDTLQVAKTGEACGFRGSPSTSSSSPASISSVLQMQPDNSRRDGLAQEVNRLSAVVEQLVVDTARSRPAPAPVSTPLLSPPQPPPTLTTDRYCYACGGLGHMQRNCCWARNGQSQPSTQCQLCS